MTLANQRNDLKYLFNVVINCVRCSTAWTTSAANVITRIDYAPVVCNKRIKVTVKGGKTAKTVNENVL